MRYQASLKGVTIVVASGDDGAMSYMVRESTEYCDYSPSFPAISPYVTAVGATYGPENGESERMCSSFFGGTITSGGGFSYNSSRPSWQDEVVVAYLNTHFKSRIRSFNPNGRGIPDVSLLGFDYDVIVGGSHLRESGTSASAPAFAAMVSLVNAARFQRGKGPIGFINPTLYMYASEFTNDIVSGRNNCSAVNADSVINCCREGFTASVGWDPTSGLGSIDFSRFHELLVGLGGPYGNLFVFYACINTDC